MLRIVLILALATAVALADPCLKCGEEVEKGWKFCPECGQAVPEANRIVRPAVSNPDVRDASARAGAKKAEFIDSLRRLKQVYEDSRDNERAAQVGEAISIAEGISPAGVRNAIGLGPGSGGSGGGRYGGRLGGRRNLVARGGGKYGPRGTETAVTGGLRWLARHQSADGHWSARDFSAECGGTRCPDEGYAEYDTGVTGLALLAFLGAGYSNLTKETYVDPHSGKTTCWGEVVKNGIKWLLSNQDDEGCFGGRHGSKYMYNHAIAALSMAEAYGMTEITLFKDSAQKGIDFLLAARNPTKAWRYTSLSGDNDTSVTSWCVMALKAAGLAGLASDWKGTDGAMAWIVMVTDLDDSRVGYNCKKSDKVVVTGKNEDWDGHETMTAIGMLCRTFIDRNQQDPALEAGAKFLAGDLPSFSGKKIDYYYWYYGSLALYQYDGPDGKYWKSWNEAMKDAVVPAQKAKVDGCLEGSWDAGVDRWGFAGGRVYSTALNVLTLEVYYRCERVFSGSRK